MQQCRRQLNMACRAKLQQICTWEAEWLSQKAEEANRTLDTPVSTTVFQLFKELISTVGERFRDGSKAHAGSPAEVEVWKDHFQAIQKGIGDVWRCRQQYLARHQLTSSRYLTQWPSRMGGVPSGHKRDDAWAKQGGKMWCHASGIYRIWRPSHYVRRYILYRLLAVSHLIPTWSRSGKLAHT